MEIQALKLSITEQDLAALVPRILALAEHVKDLEIHPVAGGIRITGAYQTLMAVSFDTLWEMSARGGTVTARLAEFKVSGFGGGWLKTAFLGILKDAAKKHDALQVQGETLTLDLERVLAKQGVHARLNLTALDCEQGRVTIQSAPPTA